MRRASSVAACSMITTFIRTHTLRGVSGSMRSRRRRRRHRRTHAYIAFPLSSTGPSATTTCTRLPICVCISCKSVFFFFGLSSDFLLFLSLSLSRPLSFLMPFLSRQFRHTNCCVNSSYPYAMVKSEYGYWRPSKNLHFSSFYLFFAQNKVSFIPLKTHVIHPVTYLIIPLGSKTISPSHKSSHLHY